VRRALGTDLAVELVSCAPGYFGRAGFALVAWVGKGTDQAVLHRLVVVGNGTLIADAVRGATYHETRGEERSVTKQVRAEDLDGDGIDEVIEETQYTRSGGRVGDLAVYMIASGELVRAGDLQISYDDSLAHPDLRGATLCEDRWTARGTPIALEIERAFATGPKTEQCIDGRFGLRDRQLVRM